MQVQVGVIGASRAEEELLGEAREVGRLCAERGWTVVCGGLGGVMEAASRGAAEAGGLAVGILPGTSREEANPFVAVAVATGLGEARNAVIARTADALIAIGGGYGTLSEIALGRRMGKTVVSLRSWRPDGTVAEVGTPWEAVDAVARALGPGRTRTERSASRG